MKQYTFSSMEIYALRDACIEEKHRMKQHLENMPIPSDKGIERLKTLTKLADQFKDDIRLEHFLTINLKRD